LESLTNDVAAELQEIISERCATINVPTLPSIVGYEAKLRTMVQCLLMNAIHFSKPNVPPELTIRYQDTKTHWEFSFADNGIGIEPDMQEKIFLLFKRGHQTDEPDGSGVGLASCRKIARLHGGEIRVESQPGKGSTFFVTISKQL
jgi:light-regulated signal transduction histidine kinase (bacteriophytochrome)